MTSINHIIYVVFSTLLQLLIEIKSQTTTFDLREAHTATFINDKLYILGGSLPGIVNASKETFLYLDCSVPFSTNELKWVDLSNYDIVPPHDDAAAVRGGTSNETLFQYGGRNINNESISLVYTFDTKDNKWSVPVIAGVPPSGKIGITPIVNYNGLMYLYSGYDDDISLTYTNDMFILDTINLSWKKASSINAPSPRTDYGAVLLPDKSILYIGMCNFGPCTNFYKFNHL